MKKVFTFFAAVAMLASVAIAQNDHRMQPGEKPVLAPAAMFKAQLRKAANIVVTPTKDVNVSTFPWIEGFETGNAPVGFTFIDADGDGFNWDYTYLYGQDYGHNESAGLIGSASYDLDNGTALTPDNWMILPAFDIPAGSTDFTLSWYEQAQDASYSDEYYSVYINTTGNTVANFTATTAVFSGLASTDWVKHTVNLSAYAGQTIYIAFRHHNCTDMFYLDIDDIRVGGPEAPELALYGPTSVRVDRPATFMAVSNVSTLSWYIDGNAYTYTGVSTDTLVYTFTTVGIHQVVVEAYNTVGTVSDTLDVNVFSCDGNTLPYTPSFTDGLGCWESRSDSTQSGWFASVDMFESNPDGQVLSISAENYMGFFMVDFPTDNWLFSPEIEMPVSGDYEIAWQVKPFSASYDGDHYGVYVINGSDTTLLFEESLTGMTDYNQRMVVLPSAITGDFQIAFRHFNSIGGYVIILDNIQIRALTAPVVTLEGPSAVENGTVVTYTATSPNATSFEWSIDNIPVDATGNTLIHTFTTDGFHTIQVIASNNAGADTSLMTVEVYTCGAISQFPYTQDFETGIRCWSVVSADPINDDRLGLDATSFTGSYSFRFSSYSRATNYNQYLISPELILPQGEYMVKFYYKGYSNDESFRVLASSTTNDTSAFTTVLGDYPTTSREWTEVAFLVPANTKYIAINYYGNYEYYLYVDDITIKVLDIVPTVTVEGPASAESGEEVTFVASAPLATSFSWTVDGVDANTNGNTLTTSFTTTGDHIISVVGTNSIGNSIPASATINIFSCDAVNAPWAENFEGNTSCWNFDTPDGVSHGFVVNPNGQYQYSHSGDYCLFGTYSDDVDVDQWAISPAIIMPANAEGYKLSYFVYMTAWEGIPTHYEVRVSTTASTAIEDFNVVLKNEQDSVRSYVQRVIDMSQFAGQTIRIAFRNITGMGGDAMMIDDIELSNTVVGINEVAEANLNLYPNPASSMVTVNADGIEGNVTVQVLDLNGRVMMQQQGNTQSFRFDVSTLAQGAYFVRLTGEKVNAIRKLIVK